MEKDCATYIMGKELFMVNLLMGKLRGLESCTIQQVITIWDSSRLIKRMGVESIGGMESSTMFTKANSNLGEGTGRAHSGGLMVRSMSVDLMKDSRQVTASFIGQPTKLNMKDIGQKDFSTAKELNTFRMGRNFKAASKKINSMERVFSINRRKLFMVSGKKMSLSLSNSRIDL